MKKEYSNIQALLSQRLCKDEDPSSKFIRSLSHIKRQGYFTKNEFLAMCEWKSSRPRRHFIVNSEAEIRMVSREVFAIEYEKRRIELLTSLKGVRIPTASAILMLTNPKSYGVIDIRVWQLLYFYGAVTSKPSGMNFSFSNWFHYLQKLRYWAKEFNVSARLIERTLFEYHKEIQDGTLYG